MVPTLLVGLGEVGARTASRARNQALAMRPEAAHVLRMVAIASQASWGADVEIRCGRRESEACLDPSDRERLRRTATALLNESTLRQAGVATGIPCDILVVADACDPSARAALLPMASEARRAICETIAGQDVNVLLNLFIPQGESRFGAEVCRLLTAVADAAREDDPSFDIALLWSGSAPDVRYTDAELEEQCAYFLALRIADPMGDAIRAMERDLDGDRLAEVAAIGLATVELDRSDIAQRAGMEAAHHIVSMGINSRCARDKERQAIADEAAGTLNLTSDGFAGLRDRLRTYCVRGLRRNVLDDVKVPRLLVERVPRTRRHILFANYAVYFRRERLEIALARVADTARSIQSEYIERVRKAVDQLINGGRDATNAFALLERLHGVAVEARRLLQGQQPAQATQAESASTHWQSLLQRLAEASASEPSLPALLFRALCVSAAAGVGIIALLRAFPLLGLPVTGTHAAATWIGAFLAPFAVASAAAWRRASHARRLTDDLTTECQETLARDAEARVHAAVEAGLSHIVDGVFCLTANPQDLEKNQIEYHGPSEWREVERYARLLTTELPSAFIPPQAPEWPGWRVRIEDYALKPPEYPYRNTPGFADWIGEAEALLRNGLFANWRSATAAELAATIEKHAVEIGMEHVLRMTLNDFYTQWLQPAPADNDSMLRLYNALHRLASPSVTVTSAEASKITSGLVIAGPGDGNGPFAAALSQHAARPRTAGHHSPCRALMLRWLSGLQPEQLAAWEIWSRGNHAENPG